MNHSIFIVNIVNIVTNVSNIIIVVTIVVTIVAIPKDIATTLAVLVPPIHIATTLAASPFYVKSIPEASSIHGDLAGCGQISTK